MRIKLHNLIFVGMIAGVLVGLGLHSIRDQAQGTTSNAIYTQTLWWLDLAWQSPGIRMQTIYALEGAESGTRLVERVSIEAPRILRRFVVSRASESHKETLEKMKALLEAF